jgi:hypothetical protein
MRPVENDILDEEKHVSKENMASSAEIVKDNGKGDENTNTSTTGNTSRKVNPSMASRVKPRVT